MASTTTIPTSTTNASAEASPAILALEARCVPPKRVSSFPVHTFYPSGHTVGFHLSTFGSGSRYKETFYPHERLQVSHDCFFCYFLLSPSVTSLVRRIIYSTKLPVVAWHRHLLLPPPRPTLVVAHETKTPVSTVIVMTTILPIQPLPLLTIPPRIIL